jgi:hypothetical protein
MPCRGLLLEYAFAKWNLLTDMAEYFVTSQNIIRQAMDYYYVQKNYLQFLVIKLHFRLYLRKEEKYI